MTAPTPSDVQAGASTGPTRKDPMALLRPPKGDTRPAGDPAPPSEGLVMLSARPDIVTLAAERLRLFANRKQITSTELHDALLDVMNLAGREVLA